MINLTLNLTEEQFEALHEALAGRVEDAEVNLDPDASEDENHPFLRDLTLAPIVEAMDALVAQGAEN